MEKIKTPILCWMLLLVMILANGIVLRNWCLKDTRPLSWDESIHVLNALDFKERLHRHNFSDLLKKPAIFCYPPLYHVILASTIGITADIADSGAFVNFFFMALLIFATFSIAKHLLNPLAGLAAASLVSCYPTLIQISRAPMIDLALTAWVAVIVLLLYKSDHFKRIGWSLAFGVALGLGMLMKWTAWVYVLGPLVLELIVALRSQTLKGGFLALAVSFLICSPWYLRNFFSVLSMFSTMSALPPANGMILGSWISWMWYPIAFPELVGGVLLLLFLPALALCWQPKYLLLVLWILVSGIVLFFLSNNYNIRYLMPVLPAVAILSVAWLPLNKKFPFFVVIFGAMVYFSIVHFYKGPSLSVSIGKISVPFFVSDLPQAVNWKHEEIIRRIDQLKPKESFVGHVVVLSNHPYFHSSSLEVSRQSMGVESFVFQGANKDRWLDFAQFVLSKTGDLGPEFTLGSIKPRTELILNPPDWFKISYREVGRWTLPDGSETVLYQASPLPLKQAGAGILNISLKEFKMRKVVIENFKLRAEPISSVETSVGRLKALTLECGTLHYNDLSFENLFFRFVKPQVNLPRYLETGEIQFISLEALQPRALLSSQILIDTMARKYHWLKQPNVQFDGESVRVSGRAYGLGVHILMTLHLSDATLSTHLEKVSVAGIPVPCFLFSGITDRIVSLTPSREIPFYLELESIKGEGAFLKLGTT